MAAWHEEGKKVKANDPWTLWDWLTLLGLILEAAAFVAIVHWNISCLINSGTNER